MRHLDDDRLVQLAAVGTAHGAAAAHTSAEAAHLESCVDCQESVDEIRQTFALTGLSGPPSLADPPDPVWHRIAEATAEPAAPDIGPTAARRPDRVRRWVAAAAAVAGLLVGAGATAIAFSATADDPVAPAPEKPRIVAAAALSVPAGTGDAVGTARLVQDGGRWTLLVDTRDLAQHGGYFEVWLLDATGRMYALGALPEGSTARLAIPDGISIAQFNIVDISAQEFNGDPSHSRDSVLRGTLRG